MTEKSLFLPESPGLLRESSGVLSNLPFSIKFLYLKPILIIRLIVTYLELKSYLAPIYAEIKKNEFHPNETVQTVNNLIGWITFIIAATVYCMTIEPTASFGTARFITTGYKLEVGHPPGAPFFMLVANLFSQFASDAHRC